MGRYFRKLINGNEFSFLQWDTEYFEVPSYRLVLNNDIDLCDLDKVYDELEEGSFLTIINENNSKANNSIIPSFFEEEVIFADFNVQFSKKCEAHKVGKKHMISDCLPYNEEIDKIAKSAFRFSRFYNDKNLNVAKRDNIYSHWVNSAFNTQDRFFLIMNDNTDDVVNGFILFKKNDESSSAVIELIAVAPHAQRKHIGGEMIAVLENYLLDNGIENLIVGTQAENLNGMNFYVKCGFKFIGCYSIYHAWKKDR